MPNYKIILIKYQNKTKKKMSSKPFKLPNGKKTIKIVYYAQPDHQISTT